MNAPQNPRSAEGSLTERTAQESIGLVAGVVGATATVFGLVLYALDPGVLPLSLANWVFGAIGIAFYLVTNRKSFGRAVAGRSTAFVALEVFIVVGLIASAGVANYFVANNPKEWDLTKDGLYSLNEQSVVVAQQLSQDVKILGFFRPTENARTVLTQAVDLYRQHTDRLSIEFINPDAPPPELIKKYDLHVNSPRIVVVAANGQFTKLKTPTEEAVTNALIRVAQKAPKKAYFLTGHGEPNIEDAQGEDGYAAAASALRNEGFEVAAVSLIDKENVPKDATILILAAPQTALFSNEIEAIKVWLDRGGRMMLLVEPGVDAGLDRIFRPYGVSVGNDVIFDPNPVARASGFGADTPVVQSFEPHPITTKLKGAMMFFQARSVLPKVGLANLEVVTLIQTSPTSWGETNFTAGVEPVREETDIPGPVPLAVAVTRRTAGNAGKVADEARLVIVGDANFASQRFASVGLHLDFLLNAANWLAGDEDRITIRPKRAAGDRLPVTEAQQYGIMFFSVNLLPLFITGFGFSVWAIRRRK